MLNYISMNILIINILSDIYIIGMIMAIVNSIHIYIYIGIFQIQVLSLLHLYYKFIIQNILEKFIGILSIKYYFPSYIIKHSK